jgi:hypothetical protein
MNICFSYLYVKYWKKEFEKWKNEDLHSLTFVEWFSERGAMGVNWKFARKEKLYVREDPGLSGIMFKIVLREVGMEMEFEFYFLRTEWQAFLNVSDDVDFNPSTQSHYRRLIYYLYI